MFTKSHQSLHAIPLYFDLLENQRNPRALISLTIFSILTGALENLTLFLARQILQQPIIIIP
ncbi:hypothetical protein HanRHA438_Chr04g0195541 [Helianthus annuus]|nr:hypothetical protein HanRHA438_Chr04g0195541 [Helianthus annuus]